MKNALTLAAAVALTGGTAMTHAYEAGDWILRAGAVTVAPDSESDSIPELGGVTVDVGDDTQLSIIPVYMATDSWGIELLAATPFQHSIDVNEAPMTAGSTKHLPPTLTVQWYPRGGSTGWQPYVGVGLNYTIFFDEEVDSDIEGMVGKADLDDSFGLSASAGVDIPFGEHWNFNAGIWYIDIDTTATVTLKEANNAKVKFDVDIDPWVYNIGIAYKF